MAITPVIKVNSTIHAILSEDEAIINSSDIYKVENIKTSHFIVTDAIPNTTVADATPRELRASYDKLRVEKTSIIPSKSDDEKKIQTLVPCTTSKKRGFKLSEDDIPCFQSKGPQFKRKVSPQFKGIQEFKNIINFVSSFEKIIISSQQELDTVWKECISIAFPDKFKSWMNKKLFLCQSWIEAKNLILDHFANVQLIKKRVETLGELLNVKMTSDESIFDFDFRFSKTLERVEYDLEEWFIKDLYFTALPDEWQGNVKAVVLSMQKVNEDWTCLDIFIAAVATYGDRNSGLGNGVGCEVKFSTFKRKAGISGGQDFNVARKRRG